MALLPDAQEDQNTSDTTHLLEDLLTGNGPQPPFWYSPPLENADLGTGAFDLHHLTMLEYPVMNMLEDDERLHWHKPEDHAERFEPWAPLRSYPFSHQLESRCTSNFQSLSSAKKATADDQATLGMVGTKSLFMYDMDRATVLTGQTRLQMITFDHSSKDVPYFRIRRITDFYGENGIWKEEELYDFSLRDLPAPDPWDPPGPKRGTWYIDLVDLLSGTSDEAVLFRRMYDWGVLYRRNVPQNWRSPDCEAHWKEERLSGLVPAVCEPVSASDLRRKVETEDFHNLDEEQQTAYRCLICQEPYDWANVKPVQIVQCGHIFCEACLSNWCCKDIDAKCPLDRSVIWPGFRDERIRFGLDIHGTYRHDDRFDAWENFERACADLDTRNFRNTVPPTFITVNERMFSQAWRSMVGMARYQSNCRFHMPSSLPWHLNPSNFQELDLVNDVLQKTFSSLSGQTLGVGQVLTAISDNLERAYWDAFLDSERSAVEPQWEFWKGRARLPDWHDSERTLVRKDFLDWVERMIKRVVNIAVLRQCECTIVGLHCHGHWRAYYNPASLDWQRGPEQASASLFRRF